MLVSGATESCTVCVVARRVGDVDGGRVVVGGRGGGGARLHRVDRPGEVGGARVFVAALVGRLDVEGVGAVRQRAVALRAAVAGRGRPAVQTAAEAGDPRGGRRIGAVEAEARRARVGRVGGRRVEHRVGGDRVHEPGEAGRARVRVLGLVDRPHREGVRALREAGVALRARAGREVGGVEAALEAVETRRGRGVRVVEAEAGRARAARIVRMAGDARVRGDRVLHRLRRRPVGGGGRGLAVARLVDGDRVEAVDAVDEVAARGGDGVVEGAGGARARVRGHLGVVRVGRALHPQLHLVQAGAARVVARRVGDVDGGRVVVGGRGGGGARLHRVDRPAEAGRGGVRVPGCVGGAHLEAVRAVRQARVVLRARAAGEGAGVELALEARAGLGRVEAEAGRTRVRQAARARVDDGVRSGRVDRPAEAGRGGVRVPGCVGGAHLEAVRAVRQARVVLRARAAGEGAGVELALEARAGLGRVEGEAGRARVGQAARARVDDGVRSGRVDRPAEAGRGGVRVPRCVGGAHLEAVRAVRQARVVLRAGAAGEGAAVELALEARAGLGRVEAEAGRTRVRQAARARVDDGVRSGRVDRPAEAGRGGVRVPGCVGGAHLEAVRAVRQARVVLRARAAGEGAGVELAL